MITRSPGPIGRPTAHRVPSAPNCRNYRLQFLTFPIVSRVSRFSEWFYLIVLVDIATSLDDVSVARRLLTREIAQLCLDLLRVSGIWGE